MVAYKMPQVCDLGFEDLTLTEIDFCLSLGLYPQKFTRMMHMVTHIVRVCPYAIQISHTKTSREPAFLTVAYGETEGSVTPVDTHSFK